MDNDFTIPSLEAALNRLRVAQTIALASKQVERLFEMNDVRLESFARAHGCIAVRTDEGVVFHKVPRGGDLV